MAFEDWKKEGIQYPRLLTVPGNQVLCFLLQRAHTFPSISFVTEVPIVFLVVLGIPGQTVFWKGYSFPNLIPSCSDIFSIFPPPTPQGYLYLLPPSVGFLFIHAGLLAFLYDFFCLTEQLLNTNRLSWAFLPSRALSHCTLPRISLKMAKSVLLKFRIVSLLCDLLAALRILNSTISWLLQVRGSTSQRITDKSLSIPCSFPWIPHNLLHYHTHFVKSHIWL